MDILDSGVVVVVLLVAWSLLTVEIPGLNPIGIKISPVILVT